MQQTLARDGVQYSADDRPAVPAPPAGTPNVAPAPAATTPARAEEICA
jgi:hypothetical protein